MLSSTGIIGYCQPQEISANQVTELKLSSDSVKTCSVEIMRVVCADMDPNGPGQEFELQPWGTHENIKVSKQSINLGSHGIVESPPKFSINNHLSIEMFLWPTKVSKNDQIIFNWGDLDLVLRENNNLIMRYCGREVSLRQSLLKRHWYQINGAIDFSKKSLSLIGAVIEKVLIISNSKFLKSLEDLLFKTISSHVS